MNAGTEIDNFPRLRNLYHGLPAVAAIIVVPAFVAMFYETGSYMLSIATVAVPVVFILWKWVIVGRRLDQFACPRCGTEIAKTARMPWERRGEGKPETFNFLGTPLPCRVARDSGLRAKGISSEPRRRQGTGQRECFEERSGSPDRCAPSQKQWS